MEKNGNDGHYECKRKIILVRELRAPRELVFKAWTDPRMLEQWWGPHKWHVPHCEVDLRPGGIMRIDMQGPIGAVWRTDGEIRQVCMNERLDFTLNSAFDASGAPLLRSVNMLSFEQDGIHTILTLHAEIEIRSPELNRVLDALESVWQQGLEHLESLVSKYVL